MATEEESTRIRRQPLWIIEGPQTAQGAYLCTWQSQVGYGFTLHYARLECGKSLVYSHSFFSERCPLKAVVETACDLRCHTRICLCVDYRIASGGSIDV